MSVKLIAISNGDNKIDFNYAEGEHAFSMKRFVDANGQPCWMSHRMRPLDTISGKYTPIPDNVEAVLSKPDSEKNHEWW